MNENERSKVDKPQTYPTICPRCHWVGTLKLSTDPTIRRLRLKASGVIEKEEARSQALQYGITCLECRGRYWMLIEFIAGKTPTLRVSSRPLLSMPDNVAKVESGEVFYSREKNWWFSKRGGKIKEIGPGEPLDTSLS